MKFQEKNYLLLLRSLVKVLHGDTLLNHHASMPMQCRPHPKIYIGIHYLFMFALKHRL